ncbi:helix-turn-helix domain-containing protein [Ameyamaea chiangmaiensis]|uniref:Helix-turn-helix domain-containing protein n=2 Tax=Ameyamaea chiangmaiensis TaxID=442969 RepID=A0A850P3Y6_9PROT|nr:helix-turn-helix domain-containing protein [Ameyamaea chiangmaiensis]NVN39367.1 helix-turn-helix domain-containing protein [Ameyamaea chiangmaiensis]
MEPSELIKLAGGCKRVAEAVGLKSHSTVLGWKTIPPHHCPTIEAVFDIPREELRPDLFARTPATEVAR